MSPVRRESRDSDPKRQRSKFDRESSPKRSRRDGKTEEERVVSKKDVDARDGAPLEPDAHGSRNESEKKRSGHHETTKQAPHQSEVPRSRSYHQHDDRLSAGRGDRRAISERESWRSSREQSLQRTGDDEKSWHRKDEDKSWRHDRFHESDDTQGTLSRKRPAFRETKVPEESGNNTDRRTEEAKDINSNNHQQNERNWRSNMHSDRHERPARGRNRAWNRDDERTVGSRQSYRADRDGRFSNNERTGFHGSGTRGEKKWDHDLFEEANKSPARASEEEQIAKVEALLAS